MNSPGFPLVINGGDQVAWTISETNPCPNTEVMWLVWADPGALSKTYHWELTATIK